MKNLFTPALLPLAIAGIANIAYAAPAGAPRLEEVIVTAEKKAENVQNVPSSISAFTSDRLEQAGIKDLQDLSGISPGLNIQSAGGGETTAIRLRGLGAQRFDQSVAQFVGVFVDEITQHRPGVAMAALMDVERIEVLRGPQNVLYGKNVPAGAISIITKRPILDQLSGDGEISAGNNEYRDAKLNLNLPLLPELLAARISGINTHRVGETDIEPANQTWGGSNASGGRLQLLFQPADDLDVLGTFNTYESSAANFQQPHNVYYAINNPFKYLQFVGPDAGELVPGVVPSRDLSPLNDPTAAPALGLGQVSVEEIDAFKRHGYRDKKYSANTRLNSSALQANYMIDDNNEITYLGGYQEYSTGNFIDGDSTDVNYSWVKSKLDTRYWSHEVRWTYSADNYETMTGLFFDEEMHRSYTTAYLQPLAAFANIPELVADDTIRDIDSRSAFARIAYDLSDDWRAVVGARYSQTNISIELPQFDNLKKSKSFRALVGEGTLSYQWTPDIMSYLKVANGNQSGGINMAVLTSPALQELGGEDTFDAAKSKYVELGLKASLFENRVLINADVFYQTYDGYQALVALDSTNTYIANAGKVAVKGAELDAAWQMTEHFKFDSTVALIDAKFKDFDNAPCSELQRVDAIYAGDLNNSCVVNGSQDLSGERVNEAPLLSGTAGLSYTQPLAAIDARLSVRGDMSYSSEFISEPFLDSKQQQGGYTLFNANIGIDWENGMSLSFWGKNLGDKDYCLYRPVNPGSLTEWIGVSCLVGQGRQVGVSVGYKMD
jgi:iron complex outermembrane recepter protein